MKPTEMRQQENAEASVIGLDKAGLRPRHLMSLLQGIQKN